VGRNVSAIAIKRGPEVLLFDCGEGTQRQFQRSALSYMQVSKIFISHFHGDHFLGLPGFFQTIQLNDRKEPIYIFGPRGTKKLVDQLLDLGYFAPSYSIIVKEVDDGDVLHFDGYHVNVLAVCHNVPCLAYCFEEDLRPGKFHKKKALSLGIPEGPLFNKLQKGLGVEINGIKIEPYDVMGKSRPGRKITLTGDTRYCKKLIEFAHKSDVLIHDSTFDSSIETKANEYGHSTAQQAAEIAKKAGVEKLFLVHISPRYKDGKILEEDARKVFRESYETHDFMVVEVRYRN
jgi:ribonuclease Z